MNRDFFDALSASLREAVSIAKSEGVLPPVSAGLTEEEERYIQDPPEGSCSLQDGTGKRRVAGRAHPGEDTSST